MEYTLAALTHGLDTRYLEATIESFREHVFPQPKHSVLLVDCNEEHPYYGNQLAQVELGFDEVFFTGGAGVGFCSATARLWGYASFRQPQSPFVFWLEHDFKFTRDVDLEPIAEILENDEVLAQMVFMRDAVNEQEKAAGGLYESRRDDYVTVRMQGQVYLEHTAFFSTNPSLMTRRFLIENAWPHYSDQCEGKFGIDLVNKGYRFGAWGDGSPWVKHIGHRTGFGY